MAITSTMFIYVVNTNLYTTIVYGIPNSLMITISAHHLCNIMYGQLIYFYILCRYLRLKLKNLNESVLQMKRGIRFIRIQNILHSFNEIYLEINEYNTTYWSKFLFNIWIIFGSIIILLLHTLLFKNVNMLTKLGIIYGLIILPMIYLYTIFTASSVNSEANKSYKYLNSLYFQLFGLRIRNKTIKLLKVSWQISIF